MWSLSAQPYPYSDTIPQIKALSKPSAPSRLMWGTDWPISLKQLPYTKAVALFRDHLPSSQPAGPRQILYKTVQQIWPFGL